VREINCQHIDDVYKNFVHMRHDYRPKGAAQGQH
jgi:hypothetical protein